MKESIAQAFIINLILVFFVVLVLLLFGSINYSKAYKAKNRIINIIEKHGGWTDQTRDEVASNLAEGGYSTIVVTGEDDKCNDYIKSANDKLVFPTDDDREEGRRYNYCVIASNYDSPKGTYYQVITHMKFEIPLIGGFLEFPVKGETKPLFDTAMTKEVVETE